MLYEYHTGIARQFFQFPSINHHSLTTTTKGAVYGAIPLMLVLILPMTMMMRMMRIMRIMRIMMMLMSPFERDFQDAPFSNSGYDRAQRRGCFNLTETRKLPNQLCGL